MLTLPELFDRLKQVDEVDLLELLDISSEELVDRFQDIIEERYELIYPQFNEEQDGDEEG